AVSHKGAMGLTQLMPATAYLLNVEEPFNAGKNIAGGAKHLRGLMNMHGNTKKALAYYYAGNLWLARPGIEKTYIEKVLNKYREFKRISVSLCEIGTKESGI
ncbi:MAG: lytic transglycosylase domain-containing protein, partial [Elusimicrobiota bacterium]